MQHYQYRAGQDWGEPKSGTHLFKESYPLRRVPLREFTVEDLGITIGQNMKLEHLLPLALEPLHSNPLAKGDF